MKMAKMANLLNNSAFKKLSWYDSKFLFNFQF